MIGVSVSNGNAPFLGVYSGPSPFFALSYRLWVALTQNASFVNTVYTHYMYAAYGLPPGSVMHVTSDYFLFSFIFKLPFIIADLVTTLLVIFMSARLMGSRSKGLLAGLLWTISPLGFLLENWSVVDTMVALVMLAGSYEFFNRRNVSAGFLFAVGAVLRLAPVFLLPVQILALLRTRRFRELGRFLGSFSLVLLAALAYLGILRGPSVLSAFLNERPGILIGEVLAPLGPYVEPIVTYNPYSLGLGILIFVPAAVYLTRPGVWRNRYFGEEALFMFTPYFAISGFNPNFILWILPLLAIFTYSRKLGPLRYMLLNVTGFAFLVIEQSNGIFAFGQGVLFIPSINGTLAAISVVMYHLAVKWILISAVLRSIFGATFILVFVRLIHCLRSMETSATGHLSTASLKE